MSSEEYNKSIKDKNGLFCKNKYCSEKVITLEDGKDGFCYICWRAYNAIHQATEYQERNERWKK